MAELRMEDVPPQVRTYCNKGIAALERGNLDYAMDLFAAALHAAPRLLKVRRLFRAAAVRAAKNHPAGRLATAKASARLIKCRSLLKKDPFQALEYSENLLRIDPFNGRFAKANCEAAVAAGLPEAAILTLEILNEHRPAAPAVLEPLADLYRETEQFDREFRCREKIAELKPGNSAALKNLKDAAARLTMGKAGWQQAESLRDRVRPETATAHQVNPLEASRLQAEPDKAREHLEGGPAAQTAMDETRKEFLYELGTLCEAVGESARAHCAFRKINAVDIEYKNVASKVETDRNA